MDRSRQLPLFAGVVYTCTGICICTGTRRLSRAGGRLCLLCVQRPGGECPGAEGGGGGPGAWAWGERMVGGCLQAES